jgi:hypothetical protein
MGENHQYWQGWAQFLQHWGLRAPASTILETAGPLTVILAQLIYFGQPLLGQVTPGNQWQALAGLLEDRSESRSFAAFLREEESR